LNMLRILGQLAIYGSKASVERLASVAPMPSWKLEQLGKKKKAPDPDLWSYASPWYRFHDEHLSGECADFLRAHEGLEAGLGTDEPGIRHAMLTLCPVEQNDEEMFACLLDRSTLELLSRLRLALEISPASVMPNVEYWRRS
jgi:hypothetical protein